MASRAPERRTHVRACHGPLTALLPVARRLACLPACLTALNLWDPQGTQMMTSPCRMVLQKFMQSKGVAPRNPEQQAATRW